MQKKLLEHTDMKEKDAKQKKSKGWKFERKKVKNECEKKFELKTGDEKQCEFKFGLTLTIKPRFGIKFYVVFDVYGELHIKLDGGILFAVNENGERQDNKQKECKNPTKGDNAVCGSSKDRKSIRSLPYLEVYLSLTAAAKVKGLIL